RGGQQGQGRPGMSPRGQQQGGRGAFPQRGPVPQGANAGTDPVNDHVIPLRGAVVVKDFAEKLGVRPNRLIADLMQLNILASINQRIEIDVATRIAEKYGFKVELERQKRSTERKPILRSEDADDAIPEDKPEEMVPRPPVVTFLGHVDHGKTSLMDRIRKTHVAAGEAGGITQAISAYSVEINDRTITFLDTPGHAAFSAMRMRGANMTDIAVIVIAADDGIMPQTKEAIADARQAGVQIMVAINKCDLPNAKPDRVRQMLQGENLTPEEWGGDIICCEVSALTGDGIDHLLEMILLQADMLELQANPNRRADGYVIEAELEQGLGPTAAMLVSGGTLKVGDILLCGQYFGKVRALIDDKGHRVKSVGPAMAAKCMGLSGVPEAGAAFRVMLDEKRARALAEKAAEELKQEKLSMTSKVASLDDLINKMKDGEKRQLSVIIKADTQGSAEAINEALRGIVSQKVSLSILYAAVGNVCETDVNNAAAGKSIIVGFNIGCESGVQQKARHDAVRINTFRIIYELIDHVKKCMLDLLPPEYKEVVRGHAYVKAVFDIGKLGRVAGCQMKDGVLKAKGRYRIFRNKEKLWEGRLASLKHFQNEVSEVTGSQECGIHFNGFEGFQPDDVIECYEQEELPRSL
ncbi:MAG: translation initiation factor IF-2, partial [Kiritimatiellae bacterium]|nr:translation initiation factor IF-2 [Kiritimatiellia bacterium]